MEPSEEYRARCDKWRLIHTESDRKFRQLGNLRLLIGLAAVAVAAVSIGVNWISLWWLAAPLAVFVWITMIHDRIEQRRAASARAIAHYEHGLARIEHRWSGTGRSGGQFRNPKHVYADDLDLFGTGSLFQLLSTARTSAGESTLAAWLLAPGERDEVLARQRAIAELAPRLDLREEIALMGDDVRSAIEDKTVAEWGSRAPIRFVRGARIIAFILAAAFVLTAALFFAGAASALPVLIVVLLELVFGLAVREPVRAVLASAAAPSRELRLIRLVLERLEKEPFQSGLLLRLTRSKDTRGRTAAGEIRRLEALTDRLDWVRNPFFRVIAAPIVWIPSHAMAIERWRRENGQHIGEWIAATGEFEALCSLASFAYERPDAVFPELSGSDAPLFEAAGLRHPLIAPGIAVPNDVSLGPAHPVWIVSGSNMSGKSTLLRSAGINAVLAWAGAPVTCGRLQLSRLRIGASIRVNDSLVDNRSRFYAEISRLKEIMDLARGGPTLFLLDELLSGTNSRDRRIGAGEIVKGLVRHGAIGLVTTHDLALTGMSEALGVGAVNVHFEDHMEAGEMKFDYRLRPGVVERSNALELMRSVGLDV